MKGTYRLWATTDKDTYQRLLRYIVEVFERNGQKVKIGKFIEAAVKEKLDREDISAF